MQIQSLIPWVYIQQMYRSSQKTDAECHLGYSGAKSSVFKKSASYAYIFPDSMQRTHVHSVAVFPAWDVHDGLAWSDQG